MTHPYHPLSGRQFKLLRRGQSWGVARVWFHNEAGRLISLPEAWTSMAAVDPFVAMARGRAYMRVADLLGLVQLVAELSRAGVQAETDVKDKM